ncbi:MAG: sulfatase-like hydrolase/transferase, partial [Planctomycetota bacterium]
MGAACGGAQLDDVGPRPAVILITVDTLRPDHLGCYGYERDVSPNIDQLAADGTRFDNAVTPRPLTAPSMASALTGLNANKHGEWTNRTLLDDSLVTLAERLRVQGNDTAAFISNYVLIHELSNLQQGFGLFDDRLPRRELNRDSYERLAEATVGEALTWLGAREVNSPPFLWVHLMDPHGPYTPP